MKNFLSFVSKYKIQFLLALVAIVAFVLFLCGCEEGTSTLAFAVVAGAADKGKHVTGEGADGVLTTDVAKENSDILENTIDEEIVKINPMSTPIDQISRQAKAKKCDSCEVEYYSVDTRPVNDTLKTATEVVSAGSANNPPTVNIVPNKLEIFEVSDTILVKGVAGTNGELVLYVKAKDDSKLTCIAVNGTTSGSNVGGIPVIPVNTTLIRMGRAAAEIDAQSPAYEALPQKEVNFCQIFKLQVEQSTLQKMHKKEAPWDFNDLEERAVMDMRRGIEKNFLFGMKGKIYDSVKRSWIYLTGGIWQQAGKEYKYDTTKDFTEQDLIGLMKQVFTGNGGNKKRVFLAGSDLIEKINKITFNKDVYANDTVTKWGITFRDLISNFGELYVLHDETFDECGKAGCGLIIDPEYLTKYTWKPFGREELNLKEAGVRNTDAVVLTEISCLALRYPSAHMRVEPLA
ncbi:MAG: DUF5309 family protein [Bacteroidales bacterium]|nr:DUF5309 family protein [Bacteroidales bacterium]